MKWLCREVFVSLQSIRAAYDLTLQCLHECRKPSYLKKSEQRKLPFYFDVDFRHVCRDISSDVIFQKPSYLFFSFFFLSWQARGLLTLQSAFVTVRRRTVLSRGLYKVPGQSAVLIHANMLTTSSAFGGAVSTAVQLVGRLCISSCFLQPSVIRQKMEQSDSAVAPRQSVLSNAVDSKATGNTGQKYKSTLQLNCRSPQPDVYCADWCCGLAVESTSFCPIVPGRPGGLLVCECLTQVHSFSLSHQIFFFCMEAYGSSRLFILKFGKLTLGWA